MESMGQVTRQRFQGLAVIQFRSTANLPIDVAKILEQIQLSKNICGNLTKKSLKNDIYLIRAKVFVIAWKRIINSIKKSI